MSEDKRDTSAGSNIPARHFSVWKGLIGFVLGFSIILTIEIALLLLFQGISGRRVIPTGLGWIVLPVTGGTAAYRFFGSTDLHKLFLLVVRTPGQRISFLSLCAALLFLALQLAVYFCNRNFSHYWGSSVWEVFIDDYNDCLSFNKYCPESALISRSLMYLGMVWAVVSLICTFWWEWLARRWNRIIAWVKEGVHTAPEPRQQDHVQKHAEGAKE